VGLVVEIAPLGKPILQYGVQSTEKIFSRVSKCITTPCITIKITTVAQGRIVLIGVPWKS
jgi:hypothetical protein